MKCSLYMRKKYKQLWTPGVLCVTWVHVLPSNSLRCLLVFVRTAEKSSHNTKLKRMLRITHVGSQAERGEASFANERAPSLPGQLTSMTQVLRKCDDLSSSPILNLFIQPLSSCSLMDPVSSHCPLAAQAISLFFHQKLDFIW